MFELFRLNLSGILFASLERERLGGEMMRWISFGVMCSLGLLGCEEIEKESPIQDPDIDDLEACYEEMLELAGDGSCEDADDCASIAAGSKACGGPSTYVVYCASAIDENALIAKVDEYTELEAAYNIANDIVSDCAEEPMPLVELVDGVCVDTLMD
jgi:hypothetical protein